MKALARALWTGHPRMRRRTYWLSTILISLFSFLLSLPFLYFFFDLTKTGDLNGIARDPRLMTWSQLPPIFLIFLAIGVVASIFTLAVSIRRRRDRDHSGLDVVLYYLCGLLIPLVGIETVPVLNLIHVVMSGWGLFLFVVLGFLPGTTGPNRYGPDPRNTITGQDASSPTP